MFPTVLFDGPSVLRRANQSLDPYKAVGRGLVIAVFLGLVVIAALGKLPSWLRGCWPRSG